MRRVTAFIQPNFIFFWYIVLSSIFFTFFALINQVSAQVTFDYDAALEEFRQNEGSEIENPEAWNAFLRYKRNQSIKKYTPVQALSTEQPSTKPMSSCGNIDFETGDFTGWTGHTGWTPRRGVCCNTPGIISNGVNALPSDVNARHTLVTGNGVDPCGGFPVVAPAMPGQAQGNYSVRLGNQNVGYEAERFTTTFTPTPTNNIFTYQYAVVIQDPSNPHTDGEKPYFEIAMFDQNGDTVPCTYYFVSANEGIPGFVNSSSCSQAIYKPWTTVSVDLSAYVNTPVTVRFSTGDCDKGGHFGYAYFNCECFNLKIVGKDTICEGDISTLEAPQEDNNTYQWSGPNGFSASTRIVNVNESGNYSVMMTSATGCVKQLFYNVTVLPIPQTDFTNPTICDLSVPFTNTSTSAGNVTWSWDFGDGNTSSTEHPTHTFSSVGSYDVTLTVTSSGGCSTNITKTITTKAPPVVNFTPTEVCLDEAINFEDQSTISGGDVINGWKWDFGDGTIDTTQSPTYTYGSEGSFDVELVVTSSSGCKDSTTLPVRVFPLPTPAFVAPDVCLNEFTDFTDQSNITTGNIAGWDWDFGNGSTSKSQDPSFLFNSAGTHTVTLTTTSDKGCTFTFNAPIEIFPLPVTDFVVEPVCQNNVSAFVDKSNVSTGNISTWEWDFGENSSGSSNSSTQQNPSHTYSKEGTFYTTLITTSNEGCIDSTVLPVIVHPIPTVDFSSDEPCLGDTTDFLNNSGISSGSIDDYSWNFGEASSGLQNISSDVNPIHIYSSPGTFSVLLTVTSDNGCQSSFAQDAIVKDLPQAVFSAPDVCLNEVTDFTDSSYATTNGAIKSWYWDFGDGTVSRDINPSHTFGTDGIYDVTLTVKTDPTCVSVLTKTITIFPIPTADFSIDPVKGTVMDPTIQFSDLSIDAVSGTWDFGDGNSMPYAPGENPQHQFPDHNVPGGLQFDVTLDVVNEFGCPAIIVKPLELEPYWTLFIPDAFTPNNDATNDTFYAKGFGIQHYEMEIYDRWGNLVFKCSVDGEPQELPCQWDGIVQNGETNLVAQQDVFVYKARFVDIFGQKHQRQGHVSMIR